MAVHPRLWAREEELNGLKDRKKSAFPAAWPEVARLARGFMANPSIVVDQTGHNWHLIRARKMQQRLVTLCVWHLSTGDAKARGMIFEDIRRMAAWEHWCWQAWRGDTWSEAYYDLSSGECATSLALVYDWLYPSLTPSEKTLILRLAEARVFKPYVRMCSRKQGKRPWFFEIPNSNWNTVCNGGAGMLALALMEESPLAAKALALAEKGIARFFKGIGPEGGWPEGTGYWNYGMRYGFMYLMSWERAFDKAHPLMQRPATKATLRFPLLFTPGGVACSFGDVNGFSPLPFHLAAAARLGESGVTAELQRRLADKLPDENFWPNLAELLLLPLQTLEKSRPWPLSGVLKGLDWAYMADRWPQPSLYAAVRGGDTGVPHSHQDLLSFFIVVKGERLVEGVSNNDYHDATFGPRRFELYEMTGASKNTLLVNGLGPAQPGVVPAVQVEGRGVQGVFLDATDSMRERRHGDKADFCGRCVLMLNRKALLVLDRVVLPNAGLVEARCHTFADLKTNHQSAHIKGKTSGLQVAFASSVPAAVRQTQGIPTAASAPVDKILRHATLAKEKEVTLAALFTPGRGGTLKLSEKNGRLEVAVGGPAACRLKFDLKTLKLRT